jgi:small basic protein
MGVIRFLLTVIGLPDSTVKYFSMSVVIALGALYFALTTRTHRERLHAAFFLIIPYMIIEVAALAYTWATGQQTIFHSADYSLGFSIAQHTLGSPRWRSDVGTAIPVPVYGDCVGRIRAVGSALCKELRSAQAPRDCAYSAISSTTLSMRRSRESRFR